METKTDESYGVVPFYKEGGQWKVLIVHQISYRGDSFWILPKGHAEANETESEAALRELTEETGVTDVVLNTERPLQIHYSFIHEGVRINKTVTYFVGVCSNQQTTISQPHEIKELRWCTPEEAVSLLTHKNSKNILEQAIDLLK